MVDNARKWTRAGHQRTCPLRCCVVVPVGNDANQNYAYPCKGSVRIPDKKYWRFCYVPVKDRDTHAPSPYTSCHVPV
jgi:hypothetical protein